MATTRKVAKCPLCHNWWFFELVKYPLRVWKVMHMCTLCWGSWWWFMMPERSVMGRPLALCAIHTVRCLVRFCHTILHVNVAPRTVQNLCGFLFRNSCRHWHGSGLGSSLDAWLSIIYMDNADLLLTLTTGLMQFSVEPCELRIMEAKPSL